MRSKQSKVCHPQAIQQTLRLQPGPNSVAGYLRGHNYITIMFSCYCAQELSPRGTRLLATPTKGTVRLEMWDFENEQGGWRKRKWRSNEGGGELGKSKVSMPKEDKTSRRKCYLVHSLRKDKYFWGKFFKSNKCRFKCIKLHPSVFHLITLISFKMVLFKSDLLFQPYSEHMAHLWRTCPRVTPSESHSYVWEEPVICF